MGIISSSLICFLMNWQLPAGLIASAIAIFLLWSVIQLNTEVGANEKYFNTFKQENAKLKNMVSVLDHKIDKWQSHPIAGHDSKEWHKLAKLETHVHHQDKLLRKVAILDEGAHHRDAVLKKLEEQRKSTSEQMRNLKEAAIKEALFSNRLARLRLEVKHDASTEEKKEKGDKKRMKRVTHLKGALSKEEALLMTKFWRLNANVDFNAKHFHTMIRKLEREQKRALKQVVRLRSQDSRAWVASVARKALTKTKVWRWFKAIAKEEAPLRRSVQRLTKQIAKAKSNAHVRGGSSTAEFRSSERALKQLKDDLEELTLHRLPRTLRKDVRVARTAMTFLRAAAHPHVYHHGYIYATMDFANPSGDDDGGPPTNGHQPHFLSLPKGWQIAPATTISRKVSINFGWSTDCLTFSNGNSWQTNDGSDNSFCGRHTLVSSHNKHKRQYKPKPDGDHTRRILMRFPVPK